MSKKIVFKAGEATVLAKEGQATDAMPEILIGAVDGTGRCRLRQLDGAVAGPHGDVCDPGL